MRSGVMSESNMGENQVTRSCGNTRVNFNFRDVSIKEMRPTPNKQSASIRAKLFA